ncbi:hypothetical protein HPP92_017208 [Vanilla planifolia]|uniref:Pterin-binding domain-containing protein n=1 Tax=Vanilla planifolia TaxID=51239 RepID=A0A835QBY2_VANPL|nr:hypothetical protein HPP92_017208 [Vanilla planifolia]
MNYQVHSHSVLESKISFPFMGMFDRIHPIFTYKITQLKHLGNSSGLKQRIPSSCSLHCSFTQKTFSSSTKISTEALSTEEDVIIALGSNLGDRVHNFNEALRLMKASGIKILRHGCLYETEPAYVTDQPCFLNSAIRGTTRLRPVELLKELKQIERRLGRVDGIRYGPRPIDLDILFYGKHKVESEELTIPHERIWERPFVLAPLIDLLGMAPSNEIEATWHSFARCSGGLFELWKGFGGGEESVGREKLRRVLPVANQLWDWSKKTHVMGVLNLTPDSFSDGGLFQEAASAVSQVKRLLSEGADIIDVGAQSTRPFARRLSAEEELGRLIPVMDAVMQIPEMEGKFLSVDTFYAQVAYEAVKRGVHMVNDVSCGQLDPEILAVVAELGVPYIMMHMRGDPCTMQSEQNLQYGDVCKEVASELFERVREAELSGIPLWRIILDPGIGFAKGTEHNLEILMGLPSIRKEIAKRSLGASHVPLLVGPSRKRFLGEICGRCVAVERDPATIAAVTAGILHGANIIRVHNVRDNLDAAKVCDALQRKRRTMRME